ncbi:MAG: hypothetical protein KDJ47_13395 [Hyphomicrobiaceae bacterium]|nr:hypothetical protein [Hyphomicrobiaceae bacterium]
MRIIKLDLPAIYRSADPEISLVSDEIRRQLFSELQRMDYEISEYVRQRAAAYLPPTYSVFARTQLRPEKTGAVTELWIVDPTVRWPAGLLTRSAWKLFVPILANVVRDTTMQRFPNIEVEMQEKDARVSVLAPTRSWRDPVILSTGVFLLTTLLWLFIVPLVRPGPTAVSGPVSAIGSLAPVAGRPSLVHQGYLAEEPVTEPQDRAARVPRSALTDRGR